VTTCRARYFFGDCREDLDKRPGSLYAPPMQLKVRLREENRISDPDDPRFVRRLEVLNEHGLILGELRAQKATYEVGGGARRGKLTIEIMMNHGDIDVESP
jgi:hypothetical protein